MESKSSAASSGTAGFFGITALVGIFTLGPIDLERTIYNWVIGDIPVIKSKLTNYVRDGVEREIQTYNLEYDYTPRQVEERLAQELHLPLPNEGEKVNPQDASIQDLWDASEEYRKSWWQGWVWPSLYE